MLIAIISIDIVDPMFNNYYHTLKPKPKVWSFDKDSVQPVLLDTLQKLIDIPFQGNVKKEITDLQYVLNVLYSL